MDLIQSLFGIFFMLTWTSVDVPFMKLTGLLGLAVMGFRLFLSLRGIWEEAKYRHQDGRHWELPEYTASRKCPYCGEPVEEGYKFCSECGKKLP